MKNKIFRHTIGRDLLTDVSENRIMKTEELTFGKLLTERGYLARGMQFPMTFSIPFSYDINFCELHSLREARLL